MRPSGSTSTISMPQGNSSPRASRARSQSTRSTAKRFSCSTPGPCSATTCTAGSVTSPLSGTSAKRAQPMSRVAPFSGDTNVPRHASATASLAVCASARAGTTTKSASRRDTRRACVSLVRYAATASDSESATQNVTAWSTNRRTTSSNDASSATGLAGFSGAGANRCTVPGCANASSTQRNARWARCRSASSRIVMLPPSS